MLIDRQVLHPHLISATPALPHMVPVAYFGRSLVQPPPKVRPLGDVEFDQAAVVSMIGGQLVVRALDPR